MVDDFDVGRVVDEAIKNAFRELGVVNILIVGRTGSGKSTLINAIFQGKIAETGQGRPVTQTTREYTKEGLPLRILDSRGIEAAAYQETKKSIEQLVDERQSERSTDRHLHVVWLCIDEGSRRVEASDIELHELLHRRSIPVVVVITKSRHDKGFRAVVQELLPRARQVVRVHAERVEEDDGHIVNIMGLDVLVQATLEVLPAAHQRPFVAAQKVAIDQKEKLAHRIVIAAALSAGGVAAVPIPFSDAALLVPIQIGMLAGISATYGIDMTQAALMTMISSIVGAGGAVLAGRAIAGALLKMVPGAGSFAGAVIAAGTASSLTVTLGELYIQTLSFMFEKWQGEAPPVSEVAAEFKRRLG